MKFILVITLCSAAINICEKPMQIDPPFNSYKECALFGYTMSAEYLSKADENIINKDKIYTKFWCHENPSI